METLLYYLRSVHPLSSELITYLESVLQYKELARGEFLLKRGHICRHIYFIQKGLFRCFYEQNDKEVNAWFMKEGDVMISVESFYKQVPSMESIQALEPSELYYISYTELQYIYAHYPEFNFIARVLTERYYSLSEQRLYSIRMQSTPQRYQWLMEYWPDIVRRVPAKFIASYLGFTPESLSRLRGKRLV